MGYSLERRYKLFQWESLMTVTKKKIIGVIFFGFVLLLLLEPLVCGRIAEGRIRNFWKRSPVGEKAIHAYDRGYFSSQIHLEFSAAEVLSRSLTEAQLSNWQGVLTSIIIRTDAKLYHCPSLHDKSFFCRGTGNTTVSTPGNFAKDVDLDVKLGWDGVVRAHFALEGEKLSGRVLQKIFPAAVLAEDFALEIGDVSGKVIVPLDGSRSLFEIKTGAIKAGEAGLGDMAFYGGSKRLSPNVFAYVLTGAVLRAKGANCGAENGLLILSGVESNKLESVDVKFKATAKHKGKNFPITANLRFSNCDIRKLMEMQRRIRDLKSAQKDGLNLGALSKLASAYECGKAFLANNQDGGCLGAVELPEGQGQASFSYEIKDVSLKSWKDLFKIGEKIKSRVALSFPKASVSAGGSLEDVFGDCGLDAREFEKFLKKNAVLSNDYYVWEIELKELLDPRKKK